MAEKKRLIVENLSPSTTTIHLFKYFSRFGTMDHFHIVTDDQGVSLCYGYVQFIKDESIGACLASSPHFINDNPVSVKIFMSEAYVDNTAQKDTVERKDASDICLYVSNLTLNTTAEQFFNYFSKWGVVASHKVGSKPGVNYGYGVVIYEKAEDALQCLSCMHNLNNRKIYVSVSTKSKNQDIDMTDLLSKKVVGVPMQTEMAHTSQFWEILAAHNKRFEYQFNQEVYVCVHT